MTEGVGDRTIRGVETSITDVFVLPVVHVLEFSRDVELSRDVGQFDGDGMGVKGQNVCLARRVAGVRFGLFECRLSGCSRCR
ncbi:hypothetical protein CEX82_02620 [Cutibacterium acnes]|nr:hypothetical protein CEX82_02620 [Cutibacterium acnes]